ncbi:MAG: hypothetical protein IPL46_10610 [Saprospiraceae bacterium]|nr:hypothetical protein [Saprospiraceae bacterium]
MLPSLIRRFSLRFLLAFVISFALGIMVWAQDNYEIGYMVTFANDTIRGLIYKGNSKQTAKYCLFKKQTEDIPKKYFPDDIKSYKIGSSRYFEAKSIFRNGQSLDYFFECLVDGILDLYYLADPFMDYFYLEKEKSLYQLENDEVYVEIGGRIFKTNSNKYKVTLKLIMNDEPSLYDVINESKFEYLDLRNLSQKYHMLVCPDEECIIYSRNEEKLGDTRLRVSPGVFGGISLNHLNLKGVVTQQITYRLTRGNSTVEVPIELYEVSLFTGRNSDLTLKSNTIIPITAIDFSWGWSTSLRLEFAHQHQVFKHDKTSLTRSNLESAVVYRKYLSFQKKSSPYLTLGFMVNTSLNNYLKDLTLSYGIPTLLPNSDKLTYQPVDKRLNSIKLSGASTDPGILLGLGFRYKMTEKLQLNIEVRHCRSRYHIKTILDDQLGLRFDNSINNWQLVAGTFF